MTFTQFDDRTHNTTHGGHLSALISGEVDFILSYYVILPERIPYFTVIGSFNSFR